MEPDRTLCCGNCGMLVEAGVFCTSCGGVLQKDVSLVSEADHAAASPGVLVQAMKSDRSIFEQDEAQDEIRSQDRRDAPVLSSGDRAGAGGFAAREAAGIAGHEEKSECQDLVVRHNMLSIFLVGGAFAFELEFEALAELEDVELTLKFEGGCGDIPSSVKTEAYVPKRRRWAWRPSVIPLLMGQISPRLLVAYRKDGIRREFECEHQVLSHWVYGNAKEAVDAQIGSLQISISQGHAGDANINLANAFRELKGLSESNPNTMIARMGQMRPVMVELPLCEVWAAGSHEASAITLIDGGQRIHLLAKQLVRVGRGTGLSDIVTRSFMPDRESVSTDERNDEEAKLCGKLSRAHCRILVGAEAVAVRDGGYYPAGTPGIERPGYQKSKWGTFVDGSPVSCPEDTTREGQHESVLPVDRTFLLTLGGASRSDSQVFGFSGFVQSCAGACRDTCKLTETEHSAQSPSCLFLQRTDGIQEVFVILGACARLNVIDPALGDLCITQKGGALRYAFGSRQGFLRVGMSLHLWRGRELTVSEFKQINIE